MDTVEQGMQRHKEVAASDCNGWFPLPNGVQLRCWLKAHPNAVSEPERRPRRRGRPRKERQVIRTEKSAPKPVQRGIKFKVSTDKKAPERPYRDIAWDKGERTCMWCNKPVVKRQGEGHHVLPREQGGGDEPSNIRLVHTGFCHDRIEGLTLLVGREPTRDEIRAARMVTSG